MVRWSVERRFVGSVPVEAFDTFSRGGEIWRVVVVFLGCGLLENLRTCLIVSLGLGWIFLWCVM